MGGSTGGCFEQPPGKQPYTEYVLLYRILAPHMVAKVNEILLAIVWSPLDRAIEYHHDVFTRGSGVL